MQFVPGSSLQAANARPQKSIDQRWFGLIVTGLVTAPLWQSPFTASQWPGAHGDPKSRRR